MRWSGLFPTALGPALCLMAAVGCGAAAAYYPASEHAWREGPAPKALHKFTRERRPTTGSAGIPRTAGSSIAGVAARAKPSLGSPGVDPARSNRLIVYNGEIYVVVRNVAESIERVNQIAGELGGYMKEMDERSITIKVPAARFREAVALVGRLGEVTRKSIRGTDVTEEMRDLRIRLRNAEVVRARLVKLLDRCEKVEDATAIEKELQRLTETIEILKGRIQYLEHSVAYSTLTVRLNSPVPQSRKRFVLPIRGIRGLAAELITGETEMSYGGRLGRRWLKMELPDGYMKYIQRPCTLRAMSADNVLIKIEMRENNEGGDIEFWYKTARKELVEQKALSVTEETEPLLDTLADAKMLVAAKEIAGKEYGYLLAVVVNRKRVYFFEAWGPADAFKADLAKLKLTVESMRIRR